MGVVAGGGGPLPDKDGDGIPDMYDKHDDRRGGPRRMGHGGHGGIDPDEMYHGGHGGHHGGHHGGGHHAKPCYWKYRGMDEVHWGPPGNDRSKSFPNEASFFQHRRAHGFPANWSNIREI